MKLTAAEKREIQDYKNELMRKWWNKQSPDERRERRERYLLNSIRKKKAAADADVEQE